MPYEFGGHGSRIEEHLHREVCGAPRKASWFFVLAIMAGTYVGLGILLIISVGQSVDPSVRNLVMGTSFGIALTLVIFAGSELFTGHTMYMTIGRLTGSIGTADVLKAWGLSWSGNLLGSVLLAVMFVTGGGGVILHAGGEDLIHQVATKKMSAPGMELFFRAILCNWLVSLAIWGASRTTSDAAKCLIIFWCLFAFIAAGFEHSVANMPLFSVTLGNATAGVLLMGGGYWVATGCPTAKTR